MNGGCRPLPRSLITYTQRHLPRGVERVGNLQPYYSEKSCDAYLTPAEQIGERNKVKRTHRCIPELQPRLSISTVYSQHHLFDDDTSSQSLRSRLLMAC